MSQITISVLVAGFPAELRRPNPLPGETLMQLVIRNFPQEWHNCVERLKSQFNLPEDVCSRMRNGETRAAADPGVDHEVERFMNLRLPSHGRTIMQLVELRRQLLDPKGLGAIWHLELCEILCPRQKNPSGDTTGEKVLESLGAKVMPMDAGGQLDFDSFFRNVHGDYLWILPGGTRLLGPMVTLIRVVGEFKNNQKLGMYSDPGYCTIYRAAALRALMAKGERLSAERRDNGRMLQEAGFTLAQDSDPGLRLAELEAVYGGKQGEVRDSSPSSEPLSRGERKPLWRRLLRLN